MRCGDEITVLSSLVSLPFSSNRLDERRPMSSPAGARPGEGAENIKLQRWQHLVSKLLAQSVGFGWEALVSSVRLGAVVPLTEEVVDKFVEDQLLIRRTSIRQETRLSIAADAATIAACAAGAAAFIRAEQEAAAQAAAQAEVEAAHELLRRTGSFRALARLSFSKQGAEAKKEPTRFRLAPIPPAQQAAPPPGAGQRVLRPVSEATLREGLQGDAVRLKQRERARHSSSPESAVRLADETSTRARLWASGMDIVDATTACERTMLSVRLNRLQHADPAGVPVRKGMLVRSVKAGGSWASVSSMTPVRLPSDASNRGGAAPAATCAGLTSSAAPGGGAARSSAGSSLATPRTRRLWICDPEPAFSAPPPADLRPRGTASMAASPVRGAGPPTVPGSASPTATRSRPATPHSLQLLGPTPSPGRLFGSADDALPAVLAPAAEAWTVECSTHQRNTASSIPRDRECMTPECAHRWGTSIPRDGVPLSLESGRAPTPQSRRRDCMRDCWSL